MDKLKMLLAVAFTVAAWGSGFPAIHLALSSFEPVPLAALRYAVAALIASAYLVFTWCEKISKIALFRLAIGGAIGIALCNIFLNIGQQTVPPGAAGFLANTVPIWSVILAATVLGERPPVAVIACVLLGLVGVALVAIGRFGDLAFDANALLVFAAAGCSAALFVIQKPILSEVRPLIATALVIVAGFLFLSPWLPAAIAQASTASAAALGAAIWLGAVPGALAYASWTFTLSRMPVSQASPFLYLVPVVSFAVSWLFLGSGLIDHNQKMTAAAIAMAEKKAWAHRS
jgi:drug/metabolite transporter (DMT)-like permease